MLQLQEEKIEIAMTTIQFREVSIFSQFVSLPFGHKDVIKSVNFDKLVESLSP